MADAPTTTTPQPRCEAEKGAHSNTEICGDQEAGQPKEEVREYRHRCLGFGHRKGRRSAATRKHLTITTKVMQQTLLMLRMVPPPDALAIAATTVISPDSSANQLPRHPESLVSSLLPPYRFVHGPTTPTSRFSPRPETGHQKSAIPCCSSPPYLSSISMPCLWPATHIRRKGRPHG